MKLTHSYSAIKQFEQCPKQYHEIRVLKRFKSEETDATRYGPAVRKAIEDYRMGAASSLPGPYAQFLLAVDKVKVIAAKGSIHCEQKMGLRRDFSPCDFFAPDVWFRGVPDLLVLGHSGETAWVGDWKTGKSSKYADLAQLELMAAMIMQHYPTVQKVKGALVFLVAGDVKFDTYTREQLPDILSRWAGRALPIETLLAQSEEGPWNARPNNLCRFCPVKTCPHNPAE